MDAEPMPPRGSPEHVTLLRELITRIERTALPAGAAKGGKGSAPARIALGEEGFALDRLLGGGLRRGALHEIVPASAWDEGAASRFALALASRALPGHGGMVWIVDDCAAAESGAPYRPGLAGHGLDPDRLVVVSTKGAAQTLWAAEEALRCGGVLVLTELWGPKAYDLRASRRLVLAAAGGDATGLLLHAGGGAATADALSSACDTRLVVAAAPSRRLDGPDGPLPVPGLPAFALRVGKARSAACAIDPHRLFPLRWNSARRCFHDPEPAVAVATHPADRPDRARGNR